VQSQWYGNYIRICTGKCTKNSRGTKAVVLSYKKILSGDFPVKCRKELISGYISGGFPIK
jgi:hypothetical protein